MDRCGTVVIFLTTFVQHFVIVSSEKIALNTANVTNNSIPHNISGLTNKTLDDGMGFTCKATRPLDLLLSAVAGAIILSGIVLLTVGYRKRRIAFFLVGFIGTGCLTYLVSLSESNFSGVIHILVSVAAGLFFSLFSTTVLYIGYFVTSLFAGLSLGFAALLLYTTFQLLYSIAVPCVAIAGISLALVFITLWWKRVLLITSTSILGATMLAGGLDYFIERLFILKYVEAKIFYSKIAPLCWYSIVVLGIWPALFIIGMLIQLLWTGKEKHKTNYVFIYRRKKRNREENYALTTMDESFE